MGEGNVFSLFTPRGRVPTLARGYLGQWGTYLGQGVPTLDRGTYLEQRVSTLARGYLPWPGGYRKVGPPHPRAKVGTPQDRTAE